LAGHCAHKKRTARARNENGHPKKKRPGAFMQRKRRPEADRAACRRIAPRLDDRAPPGVNIRARRLGARGILSTAEGLPMKMKTMLTGLAAVAAAALLSGTTAHAQQAALTGTVSSANEGAMEGVLVSVKKDGGNITVTVVSNDKGQYSFPAAKLPPGHYTIKIRAVGYDLDTPKAADVAAGKAATADITLKKTRNLAAQLSNVEWIMSVPGTDKEKRFLNDCTGCHTLQRVMRSTYTSEDFQQIIFKRMGMYSPGSTPAHPQPLLPGPRGERPRVRADAAKGAGDLLARANLSESQTWDYPMKTLPRPKGRATHVIITEYDLPRAEAQPHDVILTKDGKVWYSDFGNQYIGTLDPKTGKVVDHKVPTLKPDSPKGLLNVEADSQGNVWGSMMYQGGIAKVDAKTGKVTTYSIPKEWQSNSTQESMVSPNYSDKDGYVWTNNQEDHSVLRLNVKTGKFENLGKMKDASGKQISAYGMPADHDNGLYLLEFGGTSIGHLDAKTKKVAIYPTPSPGSKPRRGRVDEQGRLWFAEYGNNAIGMFDPKTKAIKEWQLPTPWSLPYDVTVDKKGEAWTGSMITDQVDRLDPKTGEFVEYLLPRETNIRRVFYDESGNALWVGSNHGASIVKLEPLD
jgi:virginiamycin B lyase